MDRRLSRALAIMVAACAAAGVGEAIAQDRSDGFLSPRLGELKPQVSYDARFYPAQDVAGQNANFQLTQHRVRFLFPVSQDERSEWVVQGGLKALDVDTAATLPQAGVGFPESLWEVSAGGAGRRKLDNGWIVGAALAVGSASDKPFASIDEVAVQADAMVRIPWKPSFAWIGLLDYSSIREFAPHVPLPGLLLAYEPGPQLNVLAGIPLTAVRWRPVEDVSLSVLYILLRRISAQVTYSLSRPVALFAGFDWDSQRFLRAGRPDDDQRLSYYEKRVAGGIRATFRNRIHGGVAGGYAFDRFWFEGKNYDDRNRNRVDVGDGPFIAASLRVEF